MTLFLACNETDDLPNLCIDFFGQEKVEIIKRNGALSLDEIGILLTGISATTSTLAFFYTVLSDVYKRKPSENKNDSKASRENSVSTDNNSNIVETNEGLVVDKRRVIVTKQGDICLEGYSFEEVKSVIVPILGDQL